MTWSKALLLGLFFSNSVLAVTIVPAPETIIESQARAQAKKEANARAMGKPITTKKNARAGITDEQRIKKLDEWYRAEVRNEQDAKKLRSITQVMGRKAVPLLVKVMKGNDYPEKNRWTATMMLGKIMGKQSAPFIARFAEHPAWMMRVASLKALAALGMKEYKAVYLRSLKDSSLIVRVQGLDNISNLKLKELSPAVWSMMYDQTNYVGADGSRKRTSIVKSIIRTLGDLQYDKATKPLANLIQKPKYVDLMEDLDYSLEQITGKRSPDHSPTARREFWQKQLALVERAPAKI